MTPLKTQVTTLWRDVFGYGVILSLIDYLLWASLPPLFYSSVTLLAVNSWWEWRRRFALDYTNVNGSAILMLILGGDHSDMGNLINVIREVTMTTIWGTLVTLKTFQIGCDLLAPNLHPAAIAIATAVAVMSTLSVTTFASAMVPLTPLGQIARMYTGLTTRRTTNVDDLTKAASNDAPKAASNDVPKERARSTNPLDTLTLMVNRLLALQGDVPAAVGEDADESYVRPRKRRSHLPTEKRIVKVVKVTDSDADINEDADGDLDDILDKID